MTGRSTTADLRPTLLARLDPIARAARLVLLLDERQPDALRAEAIAMRPERLWWTLTQLDDGLPLPVCQALVRAVRLGRGRRPVSDTAEVTSAELASGAAGRWLRRHWLGVPHLPGLIRRLAGDTPPIADLARGIDDAALAVPDLSRPAPVLASANSWLDAPPIIGPPPGAVLGGPTTWPMVGRLIAVVAHRIHHVRPGRFSA